MKTLPILLAELESIHSEFLDDIRDKALVNTAERWRKHYGGAIRRATGISHKRLKQMYADIDGIYSNNLHYDFYSEFRNIEEEYGFKLGDLIITALHLNYRDWSKLRARIKASSSFKSRLLDKFRKERLAIEEGASA